MTEIDPKTLEEMKRFIFSETSAEERQIMEERFFMEEDLFYDLIDLENDLVDAYARGELKGTDLKRFEASLENSPERREKIANAVALNSLIKEEKQSATETPKAITTEPTLWEKIAAFFTLQMSAMQYGTAALVILLIGGMSFLLYERIRLNQQLANYRENQQNIEKFRKQERELQNKLDEIQKREQDLKEQINSKQGESEILNQQIKEEKTERQRLENELNRLRILQKNLPQTKKQTEMQPPQPTITTIVLSPFIGGRGEGGIETKTIKLGSNIKTVSINLQIPKDSTAEVFITKFKGQTIASKQRPRITGSGSKYLTVRINANQFTTSEENKITVTGNNGVTYDYLLKIQK